MTKGYSLDIVLCLNMYLFIHDLRTLSAAWNNTASNGRTNWDERGKKLPWRDNVNRPEVLRKAEQKSETLPIEPT